VDVAMKFRSTTGAGMRKIYLAAVIALLCSACNIHGQSPDVKPHPLKASELLALAAGSALPENIVHRITSDGLAFKPDQNYLGLLKSAGADESTLSALTTANVTVAAAPDADSGPELLRHLSNAGNFRKSKQYRDAARELTTDLSNATKSPECAFVLAQVLRELEQWDRAAALFDEVLRQEPGFPEAHTKYSFVLYRLNEGGRSLAEARAAIRINPADAEAHKNAGLALASMRKFEPSEQEYAEAIRLKPDYAYAYLDLGLLLRMKTEWAKAAEQFRRATVLDPSLDDGFYNLGIVLDEGGQTEPAIQAYRQAKKIAPRRYDVRQNLGAILMNHDQNAEAVVEFRELVALYPDTQMCTASLGLGLYKMSNFEEAIPLLRKAAEMDPTDVQPHVVLGKILEEQRHDEEALQEFEAAMHLDKDNASAHAGAGRLLMKKKDLAGALREFRTATELRPAEAIYHQLYAQALSASGKVDDAIGELRQGVALEPENLGVKLELADAMEKKGDWVSAMKLFGEASSAAASVDLRGKIIRRDDRNPQQEYVNAQERFARYIASLKTSGKAEEAGELESRVAGSNRSATVSEQMDRAMAAGAKADESRQFSAAKDRYKEAVDLGEKLKPHDPRLVNALDKLGNHYLGQDPAAAQKAYERELQVAEELFGPQSANETPVLQSLGRNALIQHDYSTAEKFFFRAVDINVKIFGEANNKVAEALVQASSVYTVQKNYAKAEPYLLRAVRIDEALYGADSIGMVIPRSALCGLYDHWEQADKLMACDEALLKVLEKQYGPNSPILASTLASEAKALRKTGHAEQADKVEQRVASIRTATMTP
jgi:tetratricopeptide (TPR) repeat protein